MTDCIRGWLARRLSEADLAWLDETCAALTGGRGLFLAFSGALRHAGKQPLDLSAEERAEAAALRDGWQPEGWTRAQAARALILLSLPHADGAAYVAVLDQLFASADSDELVALYQALPLLPHPELHRAVKPGDRVLIGQYAGSEVTLDGEEHLILREGDVLGVLE